jgi:hypothetical protein
VHAWPAGNGERGLCGRRTADAIGRELLSRDRAALTSNSSPRRISRHTAMGEQVVNTVDLAARQSRTASKPLGR